MDYFSFLPIFVYNTQFYDRITEGYQSNSHDTLPSVESIQLTDISRTFNTTDALAGEGMGSM